MDIDLRLLCSRTLLSVVWIQILLGEAVVRRYDGVSHGSHVRDLADLGFERDYRSAAQGLCWRVYSGDHTLFSIGLLVHKIIWIEILV